nr:hypothetical protein CFP56_35538 [Quercus suber]
MNNEVGGRIAKEIGELVTVDVPQNGLAWGPFLRIHVNMDITKPLMRGKIMWIEGLEVGWIYFQYERLPIFCYRCGILGHNDRECLQRRVGRLSLEEDELQYGHWLRVVAPRKQSQGNIQHNHQSHSHALIPDDQAPELDVDDTIYNLEPTSLAPELSPLEPNGNSSTVEL